MVYKCSLPGCTGNSREGPRVVLFSLPTEPELWRKWIMALRHLNFNITHTTKVCQLHFREEDIERTTTYFHSRTGTIVSVPLQKIRLKPGAVPSLQLGCPRIKMLINKMPKVRKATLFDPRKLRCKEVIVDRIVFCTICPKVAKIVCSKCRHTCYCGIKCQTQHWEDVHRETCRRDKAMCYTALLRFGD